MLLDKFKKIAQKKANEHNENYCLILTCRGYDIVKEENVKNRRCYGTFKPCNI